jgi:hypothetical protein
LVLVDLWERCIEACKRRFESESHSRFCVNNGKSLAMVSDNSLDFVFSFDSLVHAEIDVIDAYIDELSRKLTLSGIAFIHHSNIGAYPCSVRLTKKLIENKHRKIRPKRVID